MTKNIIEQHHVDMVILSGGDDMDVFPMRDQVEHELIQWAESKDIPLLGVCRGMQVINSYYGGSLHKLGSMHVASRHDLNAASVSHCCPQNVNSYHANGIMPEGLGSRLIPYAYAQDQSIEAVMHDEEAIAGIMWHPEREEHPSQCDINIITSLLEKKRDTMNNVTSIILAAGRGSRMKDSTDSRPKCLLTLANKTLLDWQLMALRKAGIKDLLIVRGYLADCIQGDFSTVENTRWAETNMVSSLLCAFENVADEITVISYSDIVYKASHIEQLMNTKGDICITYDVAWESLWRLRNENPLDDAETFIQEDGLLKEIGNKTNSIEHIQGQYMGLLKFTEQGRTIIKDYLHSLSEEKVDKLDMTSLLRGLLECGAAITTCAIHGGWCECDTQQDILVYEEELQKGHWLHDWRE